MSDVRANTGRRHHLQTAPITHPEAPRGGLVQACCPVQGTRLSSYSPILYIFSVSLNYAMLMHTLSYIDEDAKPRLLSPGETHSSVTFNWVHVSIGFLG